MFIKINRVGKSNGKHVETSTHPPTTRYYYYYNYNYTTLMLLIFLFKGGFLYTSGVCREKFFRELGEGPHPTTWFLLCVCVCVTHSLSHLFNPNVRHTERKRGGGRNQIEATTTFPTQKTLLLLLLLILFFSFS
jgi:H+/Cl- antiporter ClcA